MKSLAFPLLVSLLLALPVAAQDPAPDVLVKTVTLEVIDLIQKDKEIQAGNRAKLIALIESKALPHFNFESMTQLAMGQSWRKVAPEQKPRLVAEFKTLLVRTYASALSSYSGEKFEFRPLRAKPTETDVVVQVRVLQPGREPVPIDYSMEKTAAGWKVYDVNVAGVSLVANFRTEFNSLVRDTGVEGLIKALVSKNRSLEAAGAAKK